MLRARDVMRKDVITVSADMTVEELGRIFIEKDISGAPVVDGTGNLVGIVTENDLISRNTRLHIPTVLRLFDAFIPMGTSRLESEIKKMAATTVGEICTKKPTTVEADASVDDIATIMEDRKIHLLPVLEEGRLIGIVGKRDIIRGVAGEAAK